MYSTLKEKPCGSGRKILNRVCNTASASGGEGGRGLWLLHVNVKNERTNVQITFWKRNQNVLA
jgi:hypothetical protein